MIRSIMERFLFLKSLGPSKGFTYSELMIALGLAGVFFALSIPGLTMKRHDDLGKSALKETVSNLLDVARAGMDEDEISPTNSWSYFKDHINAVKVCNNSSTEGCFTQSVSAVPAALAGEKTDPGFMLANGVTVTGLDDDNASNNYGGGAWGDTCIIDWNGSKGPNEDGKDQLYIVISFGTATIPGANAKPGTVVPVPAAAGSVTLFNNIFN